MSKLVTISMTMPQAEQFLWYVDRVHGCYYGNKAQFEKREEDLIRTVQKAIEKASTSAKA